MNTCAATTWYPRGELPRLTRLLPMLLERYAHIVISLFPSDEEGILEQLRAVKFADNPRVSLHVQENRKTGRYMAVRLAVETGADFIHYVDLDRLLHWVEAQPDEWVQMVEEIGNHECIIFGRTPRAFQRHPQALTSTETLSNQVVSHFLKQEMDVSAGSKSFSRAAAEYILANAHAENSIGSDAEWPMLMKKAGFEMKYVQVEGLEWESADQFKPRAASAEQQAEASKAYDADAQHWKQRVEIAGEIVHTALMVSGRTYPKKDTHAGQAIEFDFEAVFDVDDYMYFYSEDLTDERSESEVDALVSMLKLEEPKKILDLACGFGRHTNRLAARGHRMTGIDITPGFLDLARREAVERGVNVEYVQGDMRSLAYQDEFDYVLMLFTAFGYFDDEDNRQVLVNVKNALKPGGMFVFDSPNRDTLSKHLPPFYVVEKEGNVMIDRLSLDSLHGRLVNRRVVFRDGVRKDKPNSVRVYNPNEIQALLQQAGLELAHLYAGWDAQEITPDARRLVVIARKPV